MTKNTTTDMPITDQERRRRQKALDFARASVALSGFKVSEATDMQAAQFVAGEIDLAEFLKAER